MNTFLSLWGGLLCLAFVLTASAANSAPEEVIIIAARESRISVQGQPRWAFRYDFTPGTSGRLPSSVCIQVCEEFALLEDAVTANRNGTVHYYSGWYGFSGYCIRWDVKSYVDNQDGEDFWIANIPATHGSVDANCLSGYVAKAGPYYTEIAQTDVQQLITGPAGVCCGN